MQGIFVSVKGNRGGSVGVSWVRVVPAPQPEPA